MGATERTGTDIVGAVAEAMTGAVTGDVKKGVKAPESKAGMAHRRGEGELSKGTRLPRVKTTHTTQTLLPRRVRMRPGVEERRGTGGKRRR